MFGFRVCVLQSRGQSYQSVAVGRYRRVAVTAAFASGTVCWQRSGDGGIVLTLSISLSFEIKMINLIPHLVSVFKPL